MRTVNGSATQTASGRLDPICGGFVRTPHHLDAQEQHEDLAEVAAVIEELRELARGVRPALLDAGLGPALRELAARAPLPVEVTATSERFPPELETAAYFVACEGLTNAVKHAAAGRVRLSVGRRGDAVVVCVADDGIGGAMPANGSGLTGLSQHIETTHAVALVSLGGFGYLLKDRVLDVGEFLDTAVRVASGGSALDPKAVASLVAPADGEPLAHLSERERDVWD
jgi:hypothetical protein